MKAHAYFHKRHPRFEAKAPQTTSAPAALAPHPLTAEDLNAFFEGLVPAEIERNDIAGATVAVVKDGQILFEKGCTYFRCWR